jgi:hypothetical protein
MDSLNTLIKQYKEVTGNTYTTKEVGELLNSYLLISKICELNKEMEKRYANLKNESTTNFKETETIRTIKYYKGILENFPTEYRGEETMITLTKYNIYKHLISSQKLFLDLSKTPNAYESQGVSVNNWQNMGREFNCFIKENKEKLGNKRITESNKIITEVKYY